MWDSIYSPIDTKIIILRVHLKYKQQKITGLLLPPDRLFLRVYIDCVKIRIRIKKLLYREARNRREISPTGYHFAIARYSAREGSSNLYANYTCNGPDAATVRCRSNTTRHKCQYICGGHYITIVVRERAQRFRPPSGIVIPRSTRIDKYARHADEF